MIKSSLKFSFGPRNLLKVLYKPYIVFRVHGQFAEFRNINNKTILICNFKRLSISYVQFLPLVNELDHLFTLGLYQQIFFGAPTPNVVVCWALSVFNQIQAAVLLSQFRSLWAREDATSKLVWFSREIRLLRD